MNRKALKVLIIGLGSMGKRRIRNLQALGVQNISGFDTREDRCAESTAKFGVPCYSEFQSANPLHFDVWIISVPPDLHHIYMSKAVEAGVAAFVEASVVDENLAAIAKEAIRKSVVLVPSCTLLFHPAIKFIKKIIDDGSLGKLSNIVYHSGQYLPDWHTYEAVSDYYVSKKSTGGAREIVPFELTWLTSIFGLPKRVTGMYRKTIAIDGAPDIDDTYNLLLDYESFLMTLVVDVVSRHATRRLMINGSEKQFIWDWNESSTTIYDPKKGKWEEVAYTLSASQEGYNKNLSEQMYIEEMDAFLACAFDGKKFPNSLVKDMDVLKLLYKAETSFDKGIIETWQ